MPAKTRCSCRLSLPVRRGQQRRWASSPGLSPGQVHSPAGWRLSKPAAGLGEAPEPLRRHHPSLPPSLLPPSPGRTRLRTRPGRWLVSSRREVKGCRSQGAAPRQQVRGSLQPGWQRWGRFDTFSKYLALCGIK